MARPQTSLTSAPERQGARAGERHQRRIGGVAQLPETVLVAAGGGQRERERAAAAGAGVEQQHPQVTRRERLAVIEQHAAHLAADDTHRNALVDAGCGAPGVLRDRGRARRRVEAEDEDLVLVDFVAFIRQAADDRRPAGVELEIRLAFQRLAVERPEPRLEREAAAHAGGQVLREIVDPVLHVGPMPAALRRTVDDEGVELARIAEGHHRRGEARARLPNALDGALRREELDGLGGRGERGGAGGAARERAPRAGRSTLRTGPWAGRGSGRNQPARKRDSRATPSASRASLAAKHQRT